MRGLGPWSLMLGAALFAPGFALATEDAPPPPVSLAWNVPADSGCSDSAVVLDEIRDLIGTAGAGSRPPIAAAANVTRVAADRFHLELRTRLNEVAGRRALDADSCRALAEATALILAWMIDPSAMTGRASRPPPAPARAVIGVTNPLDAPVARTTPRARERRAEPFMALDFVFDDGTLPRPAMGVGAHLGVRFLRFFVADARASYWPRSPATSAEPSIGGLFSLFAAGASLCAGPRFPIAICAGPEVDWMRGESAGARTNGEGSDAWISFDLDGEARIPLVEHVRLIGIASWIVPSKRQLFVLEGVGIVHRPSAMAVRGTMGLEVSF